MKNLFLLLSVGAIFGMIALLFVINDPIDRCLDSGGRWNYDLKKCEGV